MRKPDSTITGNPCGLPILFFACPKKRSAVWSAPHRYERAARPLRRPRPSRPGTGGANSGLACPTGARFAQTVCPLYPVPDTPPGSAAMAPLVPEHIFSIKEVPGGASIFFSRSCCCLLSFPRSAWERPIDAPRHHQILGKRASAGIAGKIAGTMR